MNTITVGQQHYRWEVRPYTWLGYVECAVFNLIDPLERLYVAVQATDAASCTPQQVAIWIDAALRRGWYSNTKVFQRHWVGHTAHLLERPYSLYQEQSLIDELAARHPDHQTTALQKSHLSAQWEEVEDALRLPVPTVLKQLYLSLGNGHFGPDHGFFLLEDDPASDKRTLLEAHRELHSARIRDIDWMLPTHLLPFVYWESGIYSLVDCSTLEASVYVLDTNLKDHSKSGRATTTWQSCFWQHCTRLVDWLDTWSRDEPSGRTLWLNMYRAKGLI